jgi:hypothetical protein
VRSDVDPEAVIQMIASPAIAISLLDGRALTNEEIESLATLVCHATLPLSPPPDLSSSPSQLTATSRKRTAPG